MKTLILFLLLCVPAFAQLPAGATSIPNVAGNPCESAPETSEKLRLQGPSKVAVGTDVTICFQFEGDRSIVSYFRIRSAQTIAGPYFQWGRLPSDSTGVKFKMPSKQMYLFITTVGTEPGGELIETEGSDQVLLKPE